MKYERFDTGEPKRPTDKQTQKAARQRIAQRRLRSLIIWVLIIAAAVVFYVSGGKELVVGLAQNQWQKTESTREGGKAAGGLFQRGSVKEAERDFNENR
jgi:hypothetical protein